MLVCYGNLISTSSLTSFPQLLYILWFQWILIHLLFRRWNYCPLWELESGSWSWKGIKCGQKQDEVRTKVNIENAYHKILYLLYQSTENFILSFLGGNAKKDTFSSCPFTHSANIRAPPVCQAPILGAGDRSMYKTTYVPVQWEETGNGQ